MPTNTLLVNEELNQPHEPLVSANGVYKLLFDTNGTLVLWDQTTDPWTEIWATPTGGIAPRGFAILQTDGNLVVYNSARIPVWNTELAGALQTKGVSLVLEDSGKLVAYGVTPIFDSTTWRSNQTAGPGNASGSGFNIETVAKDVGMAVQTIKVVMSLFG